MLQSMTEFYSFWWIYFTFLWPIQRIKWKDKSLTRHATYFYDRLKKLLSFWFVCFSRVRKGYLIFIIGLIGISWYNWVIRHKPWMGHIKRVYRLLIKNAETKVESTYQPKSSLVPNRSSSVDRRTTYSRDRSEKKTSITFYLIVSRLLNFVSSQRTW